MKLNKIIFPVALALTVVLAGAGCKKGNNGITPLPGPKPAPIGDTGAGTTQPLPPGPSFVDQTGVKSSDGHIPTDNANWDPATMNQDRSAFAADTVHFKFDSAVINDSEQSKLAAIAQALNSNPSAKLLVEGNCDERGTEEYNRALGERRALAAREALAKLSVDSARIRTISFGKDKPVDPGHSDAAYAANRRDDFVLCTPK